MATVSGADVRWPVRLLASAAMVAVVTGAVLLLRSHVPVLSLLVLYLLAVLPVAIWWGARLAAVTSLVSVTVFVLLVPPVGSLLVADSREIVALVVFLVTAVVVGNLAARSRQSALESARLTEEQSALRRVATLVAESSSQSTVFEAVTREVGRLCGADLARMERYEPDGTVTGVAAWSRVPDQLAVGTHFALDGLSVAREVRRAGGPVRLDSFAGATGEIAREALTLGIRSSIGCPIVVNGRLWGVIAASTKSDDPYPAKTESQIASFTELVATAVENAEARGELRRMADEQAALRRVATLVARAVAPDLVFAAVAREVVQLVGADTAAILRLDSDGLATLVATHSASEQEMLATGTRWKPEPPSPTATVLATGGSARLDLDSPSPADQPDFVRLEGVRSAVATPIIVEGRCWGTISVASRRDPFLPATEQRLAEFTELVATAIANAEARTKLTQSRARIVATADETRRRIERDLHDGAQQRLVSLALNLRGTQSTVPAELPELGESIGQAVVDLQEVLEELREISRGIHPAILSEGGLALALRALARRSAVPVELRLEITSRYPQAVEVAAYYVISEAVTNTTKHAKASYVEVGVEERDGALRLRVRDDGVGGAEPQQGSGLIGLRDRVEALAGSIDISSPVGEGTVIEVALPVERVEPHTDPS
ncbi:GAF domain-containing protein [Kribbella sp. CA-253562]|uniref:GAF domain-containing protein n=1 Tax=Kribbella sp. CA-253562 TaxID=3239942 RepID=UPI003D8CA197